MSTYGTILTNTGEKVIAQHLQEGSKLNIVELAVGDGGGEEYKPTPDMTALRNEVWRGPVHSMTIHEDSPNVIVIESVIPSEAGGFIIREAGVFDAQGNLIGIMNTPQTEKVASGKGISTERHMQIYLAVSSTAMVDLTVDPALAASKEELRQHNADVDAHPEIWAALTDKASSSIEIPVNADLNAIHTPGFYYHVFGPSSEALNKPSPNTAFALIVLETGAWSRRGRAQIYISCFCNEIFIRGYIAQGTGYGWSDWYRLA